MAQIDADEVDVGLVAFLDSEVLAADERVVNTKDPRGFRPGPFVCIVVEDNRSAWIPLTTDERPERVEIRDEWRSGGHPQWLTDSQYVNDGANIWVGPTEAFIAASHAELTTRSNRAHVSNEGMAAIKREAAAQRRRRDR